MTEIKRSITIKASAEKIFQYASNYQKWPEFFEGVSDVKPITETIKGNGAKFIYKAQVLGMKMTVGTEFHHFIENEGWIGVSFKGIKHRTQWIFEKLNSQTKFTFVVGYQCPWYLGGKFIDKKVILPEWIKIVENSLKNLKQVIEKKYSK